MQQMPPMQYDFAAEFNIHDLVQSLRQLPAFNVVPTMESSLA